MRPPSVRADRSAPPRPDVGTPALEPPLGYVYGTCPSCPTPSHMLLRLLVDEATPEAGTPYLLVAAAPTEEAILAAARLLAGELEPPVDDPLTLPLKVAPLDRYMLEVVFVAREVPR